MADLPYRPCVGISLFNDQGQVFLGHRIPPPPGDHGEESTTRLWQMPQGGIDKGEAALDAARRELFEETGITSADLLGETEDWLHYDLPSELQGRALKGKYKGQKMKWFAFRFTGPESEISPTNPGPGLTPEFNDWTWADLASVTELVVPFKRPVYQRVVDAFAKYAGA